MIAHSKQIARFLEFVCRTDTAYIQPLTLNSGKQKQEHQYPSVPSQQWGTYYAVRANWCADNDMSEGLTSFVIEYDKDKHEQLIPIEQQIHWMQEAGLPFSLAVHTGGKSVHFWVVLSQPISEPEWKQIVWGYLCKLEEIVGFKADESSLKPAQAYRVPGYAHLKTGKIAKVIESISSWQKFTPVELMPYAKPLPENKRRLSASHVNTAKTEAELSVQLEAYVKDWGVRSKHWVDKNTEALKRKIAKVRRGDNAPTKVWSIASWFAINASRLGMETTIELILGLLGEHEDYKGSEWNQSEYRLQIVRGLSHGLTLAVERLTKNSRDLTGDSVSAKYVSELALDNKESKLLFVASAVGTGKTQAIVEMLKDEEKYSRVLIISHRVALINQWLKESKKHNLGLISYDDIEVMRAVFNISSIPRFVITADSLHRFLSFGEFNGCYDLVILDEADQLLKHMLTGKTSIKENRIKALRVLQGILVNSHKVVSVSAHLSNLEVDVVKSLANSQDAQVYINSRNPNKRTYDILPSEEQAIQQVLKLLGEGSKVYVACDSKEKAKDIHRLLTEKQPELAGLCVTSETVGELSESLQNGLNTLVSKLDYLICSPSLSTGFDISVEHFDSIIGVFTNADDLGYLDLEQALNRVRYPKNICYIFCNPGVNWREFNPEDVGKLFRVRETALSGDYAPEFDPNTCKIAVPEFIQQIQMWQELYLSRHMEETIGRKQKLVKRLANTGHELSFVAEALVDKQLSRQERKLEEAQRVLNAPVIDKATFDKLMKQQRSKQKPLSQQQQDSISRYFIADALHREELTIEDVHWWHDHGRATSRIYNMLQMSVEAAIGKDQAEVSYTGVNGGYDAHFYYKGKLALDAVMETVEPLLTAGTFTTSGLGEFAALAEEYKTELTSLGVSVVSKYPTTTLRNLLTLLEYTISEGQRVRTGDGWDRAYTISRTQYQQAIVNDLTDADTVY
ncbi:DEAD/DEAH box helicase family protein [Nostoc linckia FACHB-104]|nr:DEAD/DEAH box helicase family protein [Nostoc linckia FACHB-104]